MGLPQSWKTLYPTTFNIIGQETEHSKIKHLFSAMKPVGKRAEQGIPGPLVSEAVVLPLHGVYSCVPLTAVIITSARNSESPSHLVCLPLRHAVQGNS